MSDPALLDLSGKVLHAAGAVHGYARCGEQMHDPWLRGTPERLAERATHLCPRCWPEWASGAVLT